MYLMRDVAQAPPVNCSKLLAAEPQENPEPRFPDEFAAVEVAQFFFVRRRISSDFFDHQKASGKTYEADSRMNSGFLPHLHILHNDKNCAGTA